MLTAAAILINFIFLKKSCFSVFYLHNVHTAVWRNLSMPEIFSGLIHILQKRPHSTAVGRNKNGFIRKLFSSRNVLPEIFCPF